MALNLDCPKCGERLTFDLKSTVVECPCCGYRRGTGLDEKMAEIRAKGQRPSVIITNQNQINSRAVSLFHSAHDHLFQGNQAEAVRCLKDAVDIQADFLDAHLWIAKIANDEEVKRDHLSTVLAYDPGHLEATRLMLVLNGRLTPEQAAQTYHSNEPELRRVDAPVNVETKTLRCPNCGGDLTTIDANGYVECRFCGHTARQPKRQAAVSDLLVAALLERKAQAVRWMIGERLLHCTSCGAERTLAADQLSTRCPFCNSNHVIEQDALNSFEQPDGLLPFKISREQAASLIKEHLKSSVSERVKSWFDNNKIARATLNGYYLPFWVFDAVIQVNRTRIDNAPTPDRIRRGAPHQQSTFQDALYDIEVCAVKSPPPALTGQLGDYRLREMVAYEPELLAKYPAGLYTIDFDQAALQARSLVSSAMRDKYTRRELSDDSNVSISVFSNIQSMSFQLLLLPVWVASLVEEDGDVRPALVNGQTGRVVLGKAQKAPR